MRDENFQISSMIRYYMDLCNMNQNDLAKRMNVSPSAVSAWLLDQKIPRMSKIDQMCEIFGCTRNDLLGVKVESEYSAEERSILEMYRKASDQKKHIVYMILNLKDGDD